MSAKPFKKHAWASRTLPVGLALLLATGLVVVVALFGRSIRVDWPTALAAALGAAVGLGELVSRYRDAPLRAVWTMPAAFYVAVNGAAALGALILVRFLDIKFGVSETVSADEIEWIRALAAGFGAMAIFRSAVFVIRVGDQDVGIGPVSFLQIILAASDRAVDRLRAESRATFVADLMKDVSFGRAQEALPTLCLALMQNLPREDQERLGRSVTDLVEAKIDDRIKGSILGLALLNAVGEEVLDAAVTSLGAKLHPVHRVEVSPRTLTITVGETSVLTAKVFDAAGTEITDCDCVWTSSNPKAIQMNSAGTITALAPGAAQVVAVLDKGTGVASVTVS